jgi:ABC-type branched-subunit amino acid transport system substrate-binding protein
MKNIDAIIDNSSLPVVRMVNKYSVLNDVDYFSFAPNSSDVLKNNRHGVSLLPSSLLQCSEMGNEMAKKFTYVNCMVIKTAVSKENDRAKAFKNGWIDVASGTSVKDLDCSKGFEMVIKSLSKQNPNLIFVPSSDEDFVSGFFNTIVDTVDDYPVTIIGLPTWQYFQSIDPSLMEHMKVHIFNSADIHLEDESTITFRKKFRSQYSTEPSDAALQGYDAMMLVCSQIKLHKEKITTQLPEKTFKGLYTTYSFPKVAENAGMENQFIIVKKYENYELVEVKK